MQKHNYSGLFIALEGLDGSGSSTQVDLLAHNLNQAGAFAFGTKEPTNNLIGGLIRGALTKDWQPTPVCLQLLFAADRAHHLEKEIIPNIKNGHIVITDRYLFSTIAFGAINLDKRWLEKINEKFILPDITFYLKVRPIECLKRITKSRHNFELFEEKEKLRKVRSAYLTLQRRKHFNIYPINGEREISQIAEEILYIVKKEVIKKEGIKFRSKNLFTLKSGTK